MTVAGQPLGDGSTTEEKLRSLLALRAEHDDLDYKEHLDLSQNRDKLELVKDFAAMQSIPTGGYVVVGASDNGVPSSRLGRLTIAHFDPSNLYRIAHPFLPSVRVQASTHDIDGVTVALIYVGPPDPPGVAILVRDGQYQDGSRSKHLFAPGDVFVRRGAQSVRWLPSDLPRVLSRWEDAIREDERRRASAYAEQLLQGQRARTIARGPLGSLTWRLASEEFDAAFLEAMRDGDRMTLRRLVLSFRSDAAALVRMDDVDELDLLLDRLLAAVAQTVTYVEKEWFEQLLGVLVDVYRTALDPTGNVRPVQGTAPQELMLRVAVGVEAVGGLAVRLNQLWAVRPLTLPDRRLAAQIREPSWIRHGLTAASRAGLLYLAPREEGGQPRQIGGPIVALARQLVERIPALRPDTQVSPFELNGSPEPDDAVLDSLIEFDVFWCVIAAARGGREYHQYPSFAAFFTHRAEPAFALLVDDLDARRVILGDDAEGVDADETLRTALRAVASTARQVSASEGRWPWWPESEKLTTYLGPE
ncbi:hypothetical protein ASC64_17625 [Nocardioides sp. Root122]|uniref:AlbA family DNA-binding domain-containing protein n=1 Tax=Nocardioides TaxID=1839 RepID=UPI000703AC60|nr:MULTISPECIES: ATP-binding protein [Nocardioides]KQV63406.1 hypothetical protein ASC64_17625 [Nocardioides sp. Root122]MCK9826070.1 ATP-binding protein [Nocardioides cavernae]